MEEVWKDIPYLEGKYQLSNLHNVRSWIDNKGNRRKVPKILKQWLDKGGYPKVCLYNNGKGKHEFVHRLMWLTWVGEITEGYEVNHINEIKTDNCLENLNLMTRKENNNWGTRNERATKTNKKVQSDRFPNIVQKTLQGEVVKIWSSVHEVERELGYVRSSISDCCRGKKYHNTAYGYKWEYYTDKAAS